MIPDTVTRFLGESVNLTYHDNGDDYALLSSDPNTFSGHPPRPGFWIETTRTHLAGALARAREADPVAMSFLLTFTACAVELRSDTCAALAAALAAITHHHPAPAFADDYDPFPVRMKEAAVDAL